MIKKLISIALIILIVASMGLLAVGCDLDNEEYPTPDTPKEPNTPQIPDTPKEPDEPTPVVKYSVTYKYNNGNADKVVDNLEANSLLQEPITPTYTDYRFEGWYTDTSYKNQWDFEYDRLTGNVTLYAKWGRRTKLFEREGDTLYFGYYPATYIGGMYEGVGEELGSLIHFEKPSIGNNNGWTSYEYYMDGEITDFMWYRDVDYKGERYRGVYKTHLRPYNNNDYKPDETHVTLNTVSWYKYEPIEWQILDEQNGKVLIMSKLALDAQPYDYKGDVDYGTKYEDSTIRTWLNDSFYNTAFGAKQKSIIQTTAVDNSIGSLYSDVQDNAQITSVLSGTTYDKVFLLSANEIESKYGLNEDGNAREKYLQKVFTKYTLEQGINYDWKGYVDWYTRSPFNEVDKVSSVNGYMGMSTIFVGLSASICNFSYTGIVPALWVDISNTAYDDEEDDSVTEVYTLNFYSNGGSNVNAVEVVKGQSWAMPQEPRKVGYEFAGWYLDNGTFNQSFSQSVWNEMSVKRNLKIYAKWRECQHTVGSDCVCTKCRLSVHNPDSNCVCTRCGVTAHNVGSDGVCTRCASEVHIENGKYCRHGDVIYFGYYPQTEVTDSNITTALTAQTGSLPTSGNAGSWTSYGYYQSEVVSEYMWYVDISHQGNKYRGVYFSQYVNGYQDDNGYYVDTVYWFRYEPIRWKMLQESGRNAFLLCDIALDSQSFDYKGNDVYSNNYAESTIRAWLNDTFYNTAFTELQQELILTTTVDNSVESTGYDENPYVCEDTEDKIFLLSYKEATSYDLDNVSRIRKSTDYAKSQGCYQETSGSDIGNCYWWLRSPINNHNISARRVYKDGSVGSFYVFKTSPCVVPALWIRL